MAKDLGWPVCGSEEHSWEPRNPEMIPRSRRSTISGPYLATVTPRIADEPFIKLPGSLMNDLAEAETAIARFDERIGASLAGFVLIALRTEAATSSQIENLSAAASSIAVAEHTKPSSGPHTPNAELIAANVAAMTTAMAGDGPISAPEIITMQKVLLKESAPQLTGQFRKEQVWIGGTGYSPHGASHIAPHHSRIPDAINDLVRFAERRDLGGLAHIAVSHAHFETIHPFADGNGRTGRVIVQRMLRNAGLTRRVLLPLSAGLLVNTDRYFEALNAYRLGDVEPIVSTFVDATFGSLQNADQLAQDLVGIRRSWSELISARSDSTVWPLLDYCLGRPAISVSAVAKDLDVSEVAAQNAIDRLTEAGILRQNSPAKRNRLWLVSDVLDSVEQFMSRAHRR